jgi:chromosome condensin MukBEF ATPase and DNA-binding subunit MukB
MLARVAASQEEAHAAALREQAVALAQREAESVQAVRDDLDGLRRRLEEQSAVIATSDRARAELVTALEEQAAASESESEPRSPPTRLPG